MKIRPLFPAVLFTAVLFLSNVPASAAVRHWDGGAANGFWDIAANWSNNVAPANGDSLFFPTNTARLANTNRAAGNLTNFSTIRFTGSGYNVFSVPFINLTNGLTNASFPNGANTLNAGLTLRGNQTWAVGGRNTLTANSNVTWASFLVTNDLDGTLIANGNWSGSGAAQLVKTGGGRMELNGAANAISTVRVLDGTLQVDGALSAPTSFVISNGAALTGSGSVSAFTCAGDYSPGTISAPGLLTQSGAGSIAFATGARFFASINGLSAGTEHDQLRTATPPNLSGAALLLLPSASFPFGLGQKFVIITNSGAGTITTTFANLPQNARITNNAVVFQISYAGGSGNDVELTVVDAPFVATGNTRVWDGGGAGSFFSNPANWDGDVAPEDGDSVMFPTGLTAPDNLATNNLNARFDRILATGSGGGFTLRGQPLVIAGGIVATQSSGALTIANELSLVGGAEIQVGSTNLILLGSVDNGGGDISISGGVGEVRFHGVISGAGGLLVNSAGGVELNNGNLYSGITRLLRGPVQIGAPSSLGEPDSAPTFIGEGVFVNVAAARLFESSIVLTGRLAFATVNTSNVLTAFEFAGTNASLLAGPAALVQFFAPWSGAGAVQLDQGNFILNSTHSVAGGITVANRGRLFVNGSGDSDITLGQAANQVGNLGGTGQVGRVTVASGRGRIAPGNSPGILTTSNLLFSGVTTNTFELNGLTPGTGHDQLRVNGTISLGSARLELIAGFTPAPGDKLILIDNDGNDAISGTYLGLPEDSLVAAGAVAFRISYVGGTGNDVVLIATDSAFVPSGVTRIWTGGSGSRNWSVNANWANSVPARGDRLLFPASAPSNTRINVNNLAPTNSAFDRITFAGLGNTWIIQGGALKIFSGVIAANESGLGNASFGNAGVELIGSQSWNATNMALALNAPLTLGGHTLTLASGTGGEIFLQNPVLGPGALVMGTGEVFLFTESGLSEVSVTIQGAEVFAGTGLHVGPAWQMSSGSLKIGVTQIPGLTMTGGTLDLSPQAGATNAGNLTLSSSCTVLSRFDFNGVLAPPSLIVTGQVTLASAALVVGPSDFSLLNTPIVLIEKTSAGATAGTFAGLPEGGLVSATNESNGLVTRYRVSYTGGNGNDVTLTSVAPSPTGLSRTWTGGGTDPLWSATPNWTGNTPPGNGDRATFQFTAAQRDNTNPVPGLVLDTIDWSGSNYHHAGTLTLLGGLNHGAAGGTNTLAIAPTLATLGAQTWSASAAAATLRVVEETGDGTGEILGLGPVTKTGAGTLELENLAFRVDGGLVVDGGTARLNNVFFDDDSPLRLQRGRLEATDVAATSLIATNGELVLSFQTDEDEGDIRGGLSTSESIALTSNLLVTVHWTNGARVALTTSGLDLGNASLNVTFPATLTSRDSIIVARYFQDTLSGTFANLPEGAITNFGGRAWQILYNEELPEESSDNRFIILAPPIVAPVFTSIERLSSGDVILRGTAGTGAAVNIEASETPENFATIGSTIANSSGQFTFLDSNPATTTKFYRATISPP